MPAKIRKIKGDVALEPLTFFDPFGQLGGEVKTSIATFEFNKSLDFKGGNSGMIKMSRGRIRGYALRIKVKQDLNGDGDFDKDELIYKGKIQGVNDAEALMNFEGELKIKKQMHSCDWEIQKNPENLVCTADYIPEYTDLKLIHQDIGSLFDFPVYSTTDWSMHNLGNEAQAIGGGGGAAGGLILG